MEKVNRNWAKVLIIRENKKNVVFDGVVKIEVEVGNV